MDWAQEGSKLEVSPVFVLYAKLSKAKDLLTPQYETDYIVPRVVNYIVALDEPFEQRGFQLEAGCVLAPVPEESPFGALKRRSDDGQKLETHRMCSQMLWLRKRNTNTKHADYVRKEDHCSITAVVVDIDERE